MTKPFLPIHQLLYVSEHDLAMSESGYSAAAYAIATEAAAANEQHDVTGFLLCTKRWFAQVIEGRAGAVRALYDNILRDTRHHSVRTLLTRDSAVRLFPHWSMGFQTADMRNRITFLRHEISPAVVPDEPQADGLLALARHLAR